MATTMPSLIGTEKQVAWAEKIRGEWLTWQTSLLARSEKDLAYEAGRPNADPDDVAYAEECVAADRAALEAAGRQTSAAFWIDSRGIGNVFIAKKLRGSN